jgi:hypothetical protein
MHGHAGIDIYLDSRFQGQGAGREAVALLARYLFEWRGHHRLTIDPAAALSDGQRPGTHRVRGWMTAAYAKRGAISKSRYRLRRAE